MKNKFYAIGFLAIMAVFIANTVSADTITAEKKGSGAGDPQHMRGGDKGMLGQGVRPVAMGKVIVVNGNTITIESHVFSKEKNISKTAPATATYTVDASNAKITKAGAAITVSDVAVGDSIMVQGTLTGTNVVATEIFDGIGMGPRGGNGDKASPMGAVSGDGQPVVAGSVTGVSGRTLTISNSSNVSYTVDATSAKIIKKGVAGTISDVSVGDRVVAQGAVSGTSITATSVIDQGQASQAGSQGNEDGNGNGQAHPGFFGKLFGF